MKATEEQARVCQSTADSLKIKAFAGTGKTTTLQGFAARNPQAPILYLAFNKGIQQEAEAKFRGHVTPRTIHSLAFRRTGVAYSQAPNKLQGDLKPYHVLQELKGLSVPQASRNLYGARVVETIKNYLVSADVGLGEQHVSVGGSPVEMKHFDPRRLLQHATQIWQLMQDPSKPMPMVHDGYLKLFHELQPQLPFGIILADEYQDTNPVTQAIVDLQQARKVYVGDEHQAIYGFRGARNAMALVPAAEEYALTGSFRFGPLIAQFANGILALKQEPLALQGLGGVSAIGTLPAKQPFAFIARSNGALFARAVQAMEARQRFAFLGQVGNYRFDLIEQVYRLSVREPVTDPFLKSFRQFEDLEEYAKNMDDREWGGRCRLVTQYGKRLPGLVQRLLAQAESYAPGMTVEVVLGSAHRAKGMEFDHVQLADDFMDFYDEKAMRWHEFGKADVHTMEEINLQYVAATRARKTLQLGPKLQAFWVHLQAQAAAPPSGSVPAV